MREGGVGEGRREERRRGEKEGGGEVRMRGWRERDRAFWEH